jgi:hypothetical protein
MDFALLAINRDMDCINERENFTAVTPCTLLNIQRFYDRQGKVKSKLSQQEGAQTVSI